MSEGVRNFTDSNFAGDALGSPLPVVVDFWAEWCGPCKMLTPIIEEVARELAGKVIVGKLDIDENPQTALRYSVSSIPSLLFIKGGQVVNQHTGLLPKKLLLDKINKTFNG
jgi:thioredoxin 1